MTLEFPLLATFAVVLMYRLGARQSFNAAQRRRRRLRDASFYLGCLVLVLAVDSPLDQLAATLFAAHMAQHVLLLTVAPPLIVIAAPWTQIWRPLPLGFRRAVAKAVVRSPRARPLRAAARVIAHPVIALIIFNANLLAWHVPQLFDATLHDRPLHELEHALFFFTGVLFWAQVIDSAPFHAALSLLQRIAYVTATMLVSWALAVVLAFAPHPLYSGYADLASRPGGLSALDDQRIAAGVMWVPGSLAFTIAIFVFFYRWLDPEPEHRLAVATARGGTR
jgi:putative membrane protein